MGHKKLRSPRALSAVKLNMLRSAKPGSTGLLVLVLGFFCAFVLWGIIQVWERERDSNRTTTCLSNVTDLAVAALKYANDHGERLPPARDWCDRLRAYLKDPQAFVCPATRNQRCSYAFNANLSGVRLADIPESRRVVFFFESDRGWNAAGGPELLPAQPRHRFGRVDVLVRGNGQSLGTLGWGSRRLIVDTDHWLPQPQAAGKASR